MKSLLFKSICKHICLLFDLKSRKKLQNKIFYLFHIKILIFYVHEIAVFNFVVKMIICISCKNRIGLENAKKN